MFPIVLYLDFCAFFLVVFSCNCVYFTINVGVISFLRCSWLDKLGLSAVEGVSLVVRQTIVGGNYALVDSDTNPNPVRQHHAQVYTRACTVCYCFIFRTIGCRTSTSTLSVEECLTSHPSVTTIRPGCTHTAHERRCTFQDVALIIQCSQSPQSITIIVLCCLQELGSSWCCHSVRSEFKRGRCRVDIN